MVPSAKFCFQIGPTSTIVDSNAVDDAIFDRVGLNGIVAVFRCYGINIDAHPKDEQKSRLNTSLLMFHVLMQATCCFVASLKLYDMVVFSGQTKIENLGYGIILVLTSYGGLLHYIYACATVDTHCEFLRNLALALSKMSSQTQTRSCIDTWGESAFLAISANVGLGVVAVAMHVLGRFPIVIGLGIASSVGTGALFTIFYQYYFLFVCKVLLMVFDGFIPRVPKNGLVPNLGITMTDRQSEHQSLSRLVFLANHVLKMFLLLSVLTEVAIIFVCFGLVTLKFDGNPTEIAISTIAGVQMVLFVIKILLGTKVNSKVLQALLLPDGYNYDSDLKYNSGEHARYLRYLNDQSMKRAALTYGGVFNLQNGLIFTVFSTAMTYTIVMRDMKNHAMGIDRENKEVVSTAN